MLIEKLVVSGLAAISLGTIHETDGVKERSFWLRNDGDSAVTLVQGYTSCGCTTINFDKNKAIEPGDSTCVRLAFNPRGKGGEFYESGTIVYGQSRKRVDIAMEGVCITSEETLMRQFPIKINDGLRISANSFDLGLMATGETKTRNVVILHKDEDNRQECIPVRITADSSLVKGVHRIRKQIETIHRNQKTTIEINFDILISK